jgi:Asp-tRNA(Asn)/Glu-tRNA(Gln) amidotransferase A subunit family amidase
MELNRLPASELVRLPREKRTAVDLGEACLARVAERETDVQAWAHIDAEQVLAQARARDAEAPRGPLHGIPVA